MDNKELLKLKLAASRESLHTIGSEQARDILSDILKNGSLRDRELIKSAAAKKAAGGLGKKVKDYFRSTKSVNDAGKTVSNASKFETHSKTLKTGVGGLKDIALAATLVAGAGKLGKEFLKAHKLKKMSPMKRALTKAMDKDTPSGKVLRYGGAAAALGLGVSAADKGIDSIVSPLHKKRSFNKMMKDNPGLKKESPRDLKRAFNTLHRFNPKMASDPLVAGSFMKRTMQFKDEGIQPVDVKTLTSIKSDDRKESILGKAFLGGAGQLANFVG